MLGIITSPSSTIPGDNSQVLDIDGVPVMCSVIGDRASG